LIAPIARAWLSGAGGLLPWTSLSWLPITLYQGMSRPVASNGARALASRPGTVGKPYFARASSSALPSGVPSGCQYLVK